MSRRRNLPKGVYRSGQSSLRVVVNGKQYSNGWKQGLDESLCGDFAAACREADDANIPHPPAPPSGATSITPPRSFRWQAELWLEEQRGSVSGDHFRDLKAKLRNHVWSDFDRPEDAFVGDEERPLAFTPFADLPVTKITRTKHIVPWVKHLIERRRLHRSTVKKILSIVRSVFEHARHCGEDLVNPCKQVKLPKQLNPKRPKQYPEKVRRILTADQLERLSRSIPPRCWASLWLMTFMSLRISEAHGLRLGDYDRAARTLALSNQGGRNFRAADETKTWGKATTKTKAGIRLLHVPPTIAEFLDWYIDTYHDDPTDSQAYLCLPPEGTTPCNSAFNKAFQRARRRADLTREDLGWTVTPHSLRSIANSLLKREGVDGATRSAWLGHKTQAEDGEAKATALYSHLVKGALPELVEIYDAWLQENVADFLFPDEPFPDRCPAGLIDASEAAERLGVVPETIHRYRKRGLLEGVEPTFHQSGRNYVGWWFREEDIAALPAKLEAENAPPDGHLTVEEVAKRLPLTASGIRKRCAKGWCDARKVGGTWLIPEEALNEWLEDDGAPPDEADDGRAEAA